MVRAMLARALFLCSLLSLLLVPGTALAGGVGFYGSPGFHAGPALSQAGGTGSWVDLGGGVELFLGKRDSRVHGRLRFGYNGVFDTTPLPEGVEAAPGSRISHSAVISLGAKVELLEDVEKPFGLYIVGDIGVSPLVKHLKNYFWVDVGPGIRVNANDVMSVFAELTGIVRFENGFTGGAQVVAGVRLSFD
jgi:hypothetical protein